MKYSIIVPYRDRKEHLEVLLPTLLKHFDDKDFEIIISEQNDTNNFNLSNTQNIGVQVSTGNVIILHQVDYCPTDDVSYEIADQPILPARKGIFLNKDLTKRDYYDIPSGYRKWEEGIDDDFFGGVVVMTRQQWNTINGLNPLYKGWGNEDEDLRERFKWAGYKPQRNKIGTFFCLYHEDNGDISRKTREHQKDFFEGRELFAKAYEYRHIGCSNVTADVEEFETGLTNVRWIKSTNYKITI